jgi:hypothetical protein
MLIVYWYAAPFGADEHPPTVAWLGVRQLKQPHEPDEPPLEELELEEDEPAVTPRMNRLGSTYGRELELLDELLLLELELLDGAVNPGHP